MEKGKAQNLITLLGLDGKTISLVPHRRSGSICLDIHFYRTGFSDTGFYRRATFRDSVPAQPVDATPSGINLFSKGGVYDV
jgi:hypothetical protein